MTNIYETRLARVDPAYREWITHVNWTMLGLAGVGIHENTLMTPARMRRWFKAGLDAYAVCQRLNAPVRYRLKGDTSD